MLVSCEISYRRNLEKVPAKKRRRKRELACGRVFCNRSRYTIHRSSFFSMCIYTHISLRVCTCVKIISLHSLLYVYFCYLRSDFGLSACRVMRDTRQWCSGSDCVIDVSSSSSTSRTIDTDPLRGQECT